MMTSLALLFILYAVANRRRIKIDLERCRCFVNRADPDAVVDRAGSRIPRSVK